MRLIEKSRNSHARKIASTDIGVENWHVLCAKGAQTLFCGCGNIRGDWVRKMGSRQDRGRGAETDIVRSNLSAGAHPRMSAHDKSPMANAMGLIVDW